MTSLHSNNHLGASFLHKKNSRLHTAPDVKQAAASIKKKIGTVLTTPTEKLHAWMEVLKKTHEGHGADPKVMERIKRIYQSKYVITPENIPESEFLREQRMARNLGHGTIEITEEFKEKKTHEIISDQEQSLDRWIDYLTSADALYPMWAKYWAFTSMLKMGKLVKEELQDEQGVATIRFKFATRDKTTAAAFPPLNPRALALCIGALEEKVQGSLPQKKGLSTITNTSTKLSDEAFQTLLGKERFDMLYAQYLTELPQYTTEGLREIRGSWVKYPQHSTPEPLIHSLEGYPLEWCTANKETARTQLQGGDFYVYYSFNEEGNAEIPRLAIRMEEDSLAEVRGIAPNQNIDPFIAPVLEEKMKEFPDGKKYQKKSADMQRLTEIETRLKTSTELSREDLRFLYEIDGPIEGFGYEKDPRIAELLKKREHKDDLSFALHCTPEQISTTKEEALTGNIIYHHGDLDLDNIIYPVRLTLPQHISGYLDLSGLTSAEGLTLPQHINGTLLLDKLTTAMGLTLPLTIGGRLNLRELTSAEGLILPQYIGGCINLSGLTSAKGLILPQFTDGHIDLSGLTSAEGLILPQSMGGYLDLSTLTSLEGLTLPRSIGEFLDLSSLTSTEGLILPQSMGGDLYLSRTLPLEEKENLTKKHPHITFKF